MYNIGKANKDRNLNNSAQRTNDTSVKDSVLQQAEKLFIDHDRVSMDVAPPDDNSFSPSAQSTTEQSQSEVNQTKAPQLVNVFQFEDPQQSLLNWKEQKVYMALLEKFRGRSNQEIALMLSNPLESYDWELFTSYHDAVQEEHAEFQNWTKEVFLQSANCDLGR